MKLIPQILLMDLPEPSDRISGDPAPIVYFDLKTDYLKRDTLAYFLKDANIYEQVREFRFTNNNLLIFPINVNSKELILQSSFLSGIVILDLALEDKGPLVIIKGSPYSELIKFETELSCYGVVKIFRIENSKNKSKELNLVKALVADNDTKDMLVNQKHIFINKL